MNGKSCQLQVWGFRGCYDCGRFMFGGVGILFDICIRVRYDSSDGEQTDDLAQ
jgi:hypothetical protein